MNELKEQILKKYYVSLQTATFTLDKDGNSTITDKGLQKIVQIPIDDLMQLIETYTAQKELEARIDELEEIWADTDCFELNPTAFTEITGEEITVQERIKQLKTQLSSQLTNNKEGIEK